MTSSRFSRFTATSVPSSRRTRTRCADSTVTISTTIPLSSGRAVNPVMRRRCRAPTEPAPWYFSSKDLLDTWEAASGKSKEEAYDSISMMNLREMLKVLRSPKVPVKPSTFLAAMANLEAVGRR